MSHKKRGLFIVGHRSMQSELLVCHIDQQTGLKCVSCRDAGQLLSAESDPPDGVQLVLVDCFEVKGAELLETIKLLTEKTAEETLIALINMEPNAGIERAALEFGVRGFFYQQDSVASLIKGIGAIFSGDIWVSRRKMMDCLLTSRNSEEHIGRKSTVLTRREEQILRLMARGATNELIAKKLFISPHTVRTHNYNIFKKIEVPNRLQASLWAAKYL